MLKRSRNEEKVFIILLNYRIQFLKIIYNKFIKDMKIG